MVDIGVVARQIERGEDRAEKQPGTEFARDEVGVLALPAQPRRLRQGFSITAAVSTNTLTSQGEAATSQRANAFSRFLISS